MIYSPVARSLKIGPPPCMTTCLLHSMSLSPGRRKKMLYKHFTIIYLFFYCQQNHCRYLFMFVINLGWAGRWSLQCYRVRWRSHKGLFRCCNTYHWSLEVICDPFALCVVVKVGCCSTHAPCVLWRCWSPAKWFIHYRWLVLTQMCLSRHVCVRVRARLRICFHEFKHTFL